MKKLNNKGIAISSILYTLLVLLLALLFGVLGLISSGKSTFDTLKNDVINKLNNAEILADFIENSLSGLTITANTNSILAVIDATDDYGEVVKYYYRLDNEDFIESQSSNYTYNNLENNREYIVTVKVANENGLQSKEIIKRISTKDIVNPTIVQSSETIADGFTVATAKTVKITYNNNSIAEPFYYFKSSVSATVASGIVVEACGTSTIPSTCTISSVTAIVADTWYRTNTIEPEINYNSNGTLYALISDGINVSGTSTYTINRIDAELPTISVIVDGRDADIRFRDNVGIRGYAVQNTQSLPSAWIDIEDLITTIKSYTASSAGVYYVYALDVAGNTNMISFEIPQTAFSYAATDASYTVIEINADYTASASNSSYGASRDCTDMCHCSCASDWQGAGHCAWHESVGQDVSWGEICGDYSCPSGGSLSGSSCIVTTYSCPNGGTLSGTKCLKSDFACTNGGTLNGTTCVLYTCPNGGTLNGTTCEFD